VLLTLTSIEAKHASLTIADWFVIIAIATVAVCGLIALLFAEDGHDELTRNFDYWDFWY
jgi:hypothetical protein